MDVDLAWSKAVHEHVFAPLYARNGFEFFSVDYVGQVGESLQMQGVDVFVRRESLQKTVDEKAVKGHWPRFFIEQHGSTRSVVGRGWLNDSIADILAYSMSDEVNTTVYWIRWEGYAKDFIRLAVARDVTRWHYSEANKSSQARGWLIPIEDLSGFIAATVKLETPAEIVKLLSGNVVELPVASS